MVKKLFIKNLSGLPQNSSVIMPGWIAQKRHFGKLLFIDLQDSTGSIQLVIEKDTIGEKNFGDALRIPLESAVEIEGLFQTNPRGQNEILVKKIQVITEATLQISPRPRSDFDIFDPKISAQLLDYRHLYLRNPKIMAILRFRSQVMAIIREWFELNEFLEFDAPILTPVPLYPGNIAMPINVHGEQVYLSQCAGFYLEAAVHAFERIYNMGPSFRGEESRSKRHLMEYWHIKAELAWGNREDIISIVENLLQFVTTECQKRCQDIFEILEIDFCTDGLKAPYPRLSYEKAIEWLKANSFNDAKFGESLSTAEEEALSTLFSGPFWITDVPRSVEPFPYVINPEDSRVTMVADLIASNGYGELLGVAEKIFDSKMLEGRMKEKGLFDNPNYQFIKDVHQAGCVPHIAFGMGLERLIRWLLNIPHVRDAIPFPRVVRRHIMP